MNGKLKLVDLKDTTQLQNLLYGLEQVKIKGKEQWTPIDILTSILQGNTLAFNSSTNPLDSLTCYIKEEYGTRILWIWTAYSKDNDAIGYYIDDLRQLATTLDVKCLRWSSKRRGYEKKLAILGANIHQTEFNIELNNDSI